MVNFKNICTENEISTADAVNTRYNIIKEYITAKIDDSYHSSFGNKIIKVT